MKRLACILTILAFLIVPFCVHATEEITDASNTWILEGTGAKDLPWSSVDIIWILWTGVTTGGHTLEVRESTGGKVIIIDDDGEDGVPHLYPAIGTYNGINIITMGSGRLIVKVWNPRWGERPCY